MARGYKNAIILTIVLFLRPYESLNNVANQFDPNSKLHDQFEWFFQHFSDEDFLKFSKLALKSKIQGSINEGLLLIFVTSRFSIFVTFFIVFLFRERVKITRVHKIMGVSFEFLQMVKYLNNKNPLLFGFFLSVVVVGLFSVLINSQEKYNSGFTSMLDSMWYVFITVMTIGFGEVSAQSMWGQISMTIATFLGIMFTSIFVVCV